MISAAEEYMLTPLRFLDRQPELDDYLLYSEWHNGSGIYRALPKKPMPPQTTHRWWYRHVQAAGLVGT